MHELVVCFSGIGSGIGSGIAGWEFCMLADILFCG